MAGSGQRKQVQPKRDKVHQNALYAPQFRGILEIRALYAEINDD